MYQLGSMLLNFSDRITKQASVATADLKENYELSVSAVYQLRYTLKNTNNVNIRFANKLMSLTKKNGLA